MRIKIFSDFCDSATAKTNYERSCEAHKLKNYGPGKDIYLTTGQDYTHAIILNMAMPVLKNLPKKNVLGLAFEPPVFLKLTPQFIQYAVKYIGKYYIGDKRHWLDENNILPNLFVEKYAYMWHITPLNYTPFKKNLMSIMVSNKGGAPGHKYRHSLVKHILANGFPIDIYGTGANLYKNMSMYKNDVRIKGEFKELEPYEHYTFHICIENFSVNAYFSEKITNTLLCGTTPIYLGCTTILTYFPANVIVLTGKMVEDMTLLRDILLHPRKYTAKLNMPHIKQKLNLLANIKEHFA